MPFKDQQEYTVREEPKPVCCNKCNCTGFILSRVKREGYDGTKTGRCSCENGNRKSPKILSYDELQNRLGFQGYEFVAEQALGEMEEMVYEDVIKLNQLNFKGMVVKKCLKCGEEYRVEHYKEIPIAWIIEIHEYCKERKNNLCSLCWYNKGKNLGHWE